jgi:hypothetical protein
MNNVFFLKKPHRACGSTSYLMNLTKKFNDVTILLAHAYPLHKWFMQNNIKFFPYSTFLNQIRMYNTDSIAILTDYDGKTEQHRQLLDGILGSKPSNMILLIEDTTKTAPTMDGGYIQYKSGTII